jgi:hypothetical protein
MIPYVLVRFYAHILNIRSHLIPSIITTSYTYDNSELVRKNALELEEIIILKILRRLSIALGVVLYFVICLF